MKEWDRGWGEKGGGSREGGGVQVSTWSDVEVADTNTSTHTRPYCVNMVVRSALCFKN